MKRYRNINETDFPISREEKSAFCSAVRGWDEFLVFSLNMNFKYAFMGGVDTDDGLSGMKEISTTVANTSIFTLRYARLSWKEMKSSMMMLNERWIMFFINFFFDAPLEHWNWYCFHRVKTKSLHSLIWLAFPSIDEQELLDDRVYDRSVCSSVWYNVLWNFCIGRSATMGWANLRRAKGLGPGSCKRCNRNFIRESL